ncbi:cytochrome c biogenesis protein ResB [Serpentinimonas barnesii]|uniref:cytochrome c biogenesis protein ResB n=1 Tax=Serpentinimonas barnesii TaxID=1458427 RepID=UPI0004980F1C|nr:cytochrome c biogenesis protein ResB [Serpentinimonas barnesii]
MSVSTAGIQLQRGSEAVRQLVELLSSMRFAIALLTIISIASVIGTVILQNEAINSYINQFGPFWYRVFEVMGLYTVFSAWWFALMLAFLVLSTTLCVVRTSPKMLADIRQFKENVREQSLKAFPLRAQAVLAEGAEAAAQRMGQTLVASGWKVRLQRRETPTGQGWMVAAKAGAWNKLGYILTHSAIVVICAGALLDGRLMVQVQTLFLGKTTFEGGGLISEVPDEHRLSDWNPSFRGSILVTEGATTGTAILPQPGGVLLQELPFRIELKDFIVEYYETGQPKLFASEILIHDLYTGEVIPKRVMVNHPAYHRGVTIFQASYDDGGSLVRLRGLPMGDGAAPFDISGRIGQSTTLTRGGETFTLEFTDFNLYNVENFANTPDATAAVEGGEGFNLGSEIQRRLGSAHRTVSETDMRNVGPSVTYKLRDAAGQAREFHNFMFPVELDGQRVFVLGVRETQAEDFRYLRIPVDDQDQVDGFLRLRAALADPAMRREAVRRYVAEAAAGQRPELQQALAVSAQRALDLFAGQDPEIPNLPQRDMPVLAGLQAVSAFMEVNVPEAERERAGEVLLRILNGGLFELYQLSREQANLAPAPRNEQTATFMTQSVLSLSDSFFYPAPLTFMMSDFEQVEASVFQVARAPGRNIVYFGCFLLTLGMIAMLYVRERRVWVWLAPKPEGDGLDATMAMSSNRKISDNDRDFVLLRQHLLLQPPKANS